MDFLQNEELERIEGTVDEVIFHSEESGYSVLVLECAGMDEPITAV